MADGLIQVPTDSTGKKVDTTEITVGANTVERQRSVIAGGAAAELADVKNAAPGAALYGLVARVIQRREGQVLTTTALGISGAYTQAWQDANGDGATFVQAVARADVASATNGFVIQETDDDTDANFTRTLAQATVSANTTTVIRATVRGRKYRVQYTNGATGQTTFKLTSSTASEDLQPSGFSDDPVRVDPTGTTTQPVSGTVTANAGTGTFSADVTDRAARLVGQVEGRAASGAAKAGNPVQVGGVFNTTQPTVTTGQAVEAQATARGAAIVATGADVFNVTVNAALPAGTNAIGTVTAAQTVAANLKAEVVGPTADNAANPTAKVATLPVKATAADPVWTEGNVAPLSADLAGFLRSKVSSWLGSTAPTVGQKAMASSLPVVVASDQSAVPTAGGETGATAAVVPAKASYSGNRGTTANPTAVTDGQLVGDMADKVGRQVVVLEHVRDLQVDSGAITLSTTTETTLIAAGAAGVFHDLTDIFITNTSATAVRVDFRDATAGAIRFSIGLAANGGGVFSPKKAIKQTTAANNWTVQLSGAVTDVRIFAQAVKNT